MIEIEIIGMNKNNFYLTRCKNILYLKSLIILNIANKLNYKRPIIRLENLKLMEPPYDIYINIFISNVFI